MYASSFSSTPTSLLRLRATGGLGVASALRFVPRGASFELFPFCQGDVTVDSIVCGDGCELDSDVVRPGSFCDRAFAALSCFLEVLPSFPVSFRPCNTDGGSKDSVPIRKPCSVELYRRPEGVEAGVMALQDGRSMISFRETAEGILQEQSA